MILLAETQKNKPDFELVELELFMVHLKNVQDIVERRRSQGK